MPRTVHVPMSADQREVIEAYLSDDPGIEIVGSGGPRFTGKTAVGVWCIGMRRLKYENTRALVLRKVTRTTDLNLGDEFRQFFFKELGIPLGELRAGEAQYFEKEKQFRLPGNRLIQLGYCFRANDWQEHVGLQWDDIWMEQAEQWAETVFDKFRGSNRPSTKAHIQCRPRMLLTANPGGIGGEWLYRRLIDQKTRDRRTKWVQSNIYDSPATLERDPSYILRSLNAIKDPILRAQWRDGRWDLFSGQVFRMPHDTIREVDVPYWADWNAGVDWGRAKPFACIWLATWVDRNGDLHGHVTGEVYQAGLQLDQQARRALAKEARLKDRYKYMHAVNLRLADPMTAAPMERETSEATRSFALIWREHGFLTYPAHKYARLSKWELLQYLMTEGLLTIDPSCMALIKEIMGAVREEGGEDIDQKRCEDHALDALGYVLSDAHTFGISFIKKREERKRLDDLRIPVL